MNLIRRMYRFFDNYLASGGRDSVGRPACMGMFLVEARRPISNQLRFEYRDEDPEWYKHEEFRTSSRLPH